MQSRLTAVEPSDKTDGHVIDPLRYFAVEYSMTLNSVHRRSLRKVIENNQNNLRKGFSSDFVPIGLFASREEADFFIEQFNHMLAEQAQLAFHSRNWQRVADVVEELIQRVTQYSAKEK
jgi:hypothetical protein